MKTFVEKITQYFALTVGALLIACLAAIVWHFRAESSPFSLLLIVYLIWTNALSAICIAMYFIDKRRASKGQYRIPESRLHLVEILGGWPGAIIARRAFRHKTKKPPTACVSG